MKSAVRLVIFASALIAVSLAYPGSRPSGEPCDDDAATGGERIVLLARNGDSNEDDFNSGFPGSFSIPSNPWEGFMSGFQDMMTKFRQQLAHNLPTFSNQDGFFSFGNVPEGANTTSTKKVINGHVVTINETTYSGNDDDTGTIVRIRIIDVKPEDEASVTGNPDAEGLQTPSEPEDIPVATTSTERSVESVENLAENEIPEPVRLTGPQAV